MSDTLDLVLPGPSVLPSWIFLVHVTTPMELVLLALCMKVAHAVDRPVPLHFRALSRKEVSS